jgi:hypothetical protein
MGGTRLTGHLWSVRGFYGSFTDCKSDLQTVIITHRQVRELLRAQLGEQFKGSSYYTRYIFPLYFIVYLRPWAGLIASLKHYLKGDLKGNLEGISLYTHLYFLLCFYGSIKVFTEAIRIWFYF